MTSYLASGLSATPSRRFTAPLLPNPLQGLPVRGSRAKRRPLRATKKMRLSSLPLSPPQAAGEFPSQ